MSFLTRDTADPESNIISIATSPSKPVTTSAFVLMAATVIKMFVSGPFIVEDSCDPLFTSPGRFPASYNLS